LLLPIRQPIILDLDGDGTNFVSASNSNALFDLDGDGVRDDTSWISSGDAFLFLDRDGDGFVSGVGEISFVDDVKDARSDLDGLRSFDSNGDGILSSADVRFDEFGVWQDLDTDGEVDAGETFTLTEAGIVSIDLDATPTEAGFGFGDVAIVNQGSFERADGSTGGYADAAITFFEKGTPQLPTISFDRQSYGRKSKKYRLYSRNGELMIGGKKRANETLAGATIMRFRNRTIGLLSPVVLDLDGNGVKLVNGRKTDAWFDMDGNGRADDTGWIARGDGFLVVDRNNNGIIDNGSELSFLAEAPGAKNGLQALTAFDSNGDGVISTGDVRFNELKVWVDRNSNGRTDAGELRTLNDQGIASISLEAQATNNRVKVGKNILLANSTFTRTDGSVGQVGDAVLSFTPSAAPRPSYQIGNRRWSMEDYTRRANDSGLHAPVEGRFAEPEISYPYSTFTRLDRSVSRAGVSTTSSTQLVDRRPRDNGGYSGISMAEYINITTGFGGPNTPVERRFAEPDIPSIEFPELTALRAGLNSTPAKLTGQGLIFDIPTGINVFDFFEKVEAGAVTLAIETETASLPETNVSADIFSKERVPQSSTGLAVPEQSTGNNAVSDVGPSENADGQEDQDQAETTSPDTVAANENSEPDKVAPGVAAGMLMAEYQGGPAKVDPDILKLALMTQDMNTFGVTAAGESFLEERRQPVPVELFGA